MLPLLHRLRSKVDFQQVYTGGKTLNTAFFRIKTRANGLTHSRFGVVVPNKLMKKAVDRNRTKRRIRAALVSVCGEVVPGFDIVLMAQSAVKEASVDEIGEDLRAAFGKIGFISAKK